MPEGERPGGLGRLPSADERDARFPLMAAVSAVRAEVEPLTKRYWWRDGWHGDQGMTPQCVAYAWCHFLEDGPLTHAPRKPGEGPVVVPGSLYRMAQERDEWAGTNYDGTSVRAGAKALQELGFISVYRWGRSVDELAQGVLYLGPSVIGTLWTADMDEPDAKGFIHYSGRELGGHAYLVNGVNTREDKFRVKNSWGRAWGQGGHAWVSFEDMARLIADDGEVCIAEEVKRP